MGSLSIFHWLIVLLVVIVIFGTKKLRDVGPDLGKAVKGFKDGLKGEEEKTAAQNNAPSQVADKTTIDVEAKEKAKTE